MSENVRPSAWTSPRIENTFVYHPPADLDKEERARTVEAYQQIRAAGGLFACLIGAYSQPTAEEARAINCIQEAVMLANASIAIGGVEMGASKDGIAKALLVSKFADTLGFHFHNQGDDEPITGETSDGYHTFDELYEHRAQLFIALMDASAATCHCWISRHHHDSDQPMHEGYFIAGMMLRNGPITYHLPERLWLQCMAAGAKVVETGAEWDGHTSADVLTRLERHVQKPFDDDEFVDV